MVKNNPIEMTDQEILDKIPPDELAAALKFYTDFHWGYEPDKLYGIKWPHLPKSLSLLGYWRAVIYQASKKGDGKDVFYIHTFEPEFPILASDPDGKQIWVLGGDYSIKKAGITG